MSINGKGLGNINSDPNPREQRSTETDGGVLFQSNVNDVDEKNKSAVSIMRRMHLHNNDDKQAPGSEQNVEHENEEFKKELKPISHGKNKEKDITKETNEHDAAILWKDISHDLVKPSNNPLSKDHLISKDENLKSPDDKEQHLSAKDPRSAKTLANTDNEFSENSGFTHDFGENVFDATDNFNQPLGKKKMSVFGQDSVLSKESDAENQPSNEFENDDWDSSEEEEYKELCLRKEELMRLKAELRENLKKPKLVERTRNFKLDTYLQHCQLLQNYSHLPSLDINQRLELVKMFYPKMVIRDVILKKQSPSYCTLVFTLIFPQVIKFKVDLTFDSGEVIRSLKITMGQNIFVNSECKEITELAIYCRKRADISLFMFSMNSFVDLFRERTALWVDLFVSYFHKSIRINSMVSKEHQNDNLRLLGYSVLKNSRTFDFILPTQELIINYGFYFPVHPNYCDISFVGDCNSFLTCVLYTEDKGKDKILDLTSTLNGLVKVEGLYNGCCRLLNSLK
ncbi:hypothetical protein HII12_000996 [Brettanomyces bruxellensis]|uniref:Uncharacterized protein n=2 Tax=Dekkera bruxellensis TaxID=5007 RepID=A0A8H6BPK9_DEKBR|nr:hypothetical protein HII12_000996 [Brettanomyces bruxellensis]